MKQSIVILFSLLVVCSCAKKTIEQPDSIYVGVIVDVTDHRQVYPDAEKILPLFDFNTKENSAAYFKICTITDRELNLDIEFHLATSAITQNDNIDDDPDFRKKLIVQFFDSIRSAITQFNTRINRDSIYTYSECFKTIAGELQNIVNHKTDKAILLIYSDLQEKSALFNCYTKYSQKLLASYPEKIAAIFEKTLLLPKNLNNIKICFVYNPVSRDDDIRFMAMLKVYERMLSARGVMVIVRSDNPKYLYP